MCTDCGFYFGGPLEMYEHAKVHNKQSLEKPDGSNLVCEKCNVDLGTHENYTWHMKETHKQKNAKPFRCRWCGERSGSLQGLYLHIRLSHKCENAVPQTVVSSAMITKTPANKAAKYLCNICGKVSGSSFKYKIHMNVHKEAEIYKCNLCPAKYT